MKTCSFYFTASEKEIAEILHSVNVLAQRRMTWKFKNHNGLFSKKEAEISITGNDNIRREAFKVLSALEVFN